MLSMFLSSEVPIKPPRAFLSFVTKDKPLVDVFRFELASRYADLGFVDHAVKDKYDKNWKLECAVKIEQAALLICLVGTSTYRSKPVAWEIDRGLSHGKQVVAINLTDRQVRIPSVLIRNSIAVVSYRAIYAA